MQKMLAFMLNGVGFLAWIIINRFFTNENATRMNTQGDKASLGWLLCIPQNVLVPYSRTPAAYVTPETTKTNSGQFLKH